MLRVLAEVIGAEARCSRRHQLRRSPQRPRGGDRSRGAVNVPTASRSAEPTIASARRWAELSWGAGDPSDQKMEAPPGIEPGMEVLQTSALPLGDGALQELTMDRITRVSRTLGPTTTRGEMLAQSHRSRSLSFLAQIRPGHAPH